MESCMFLFYDHLNFPDIVRLTLVARSYRDMIRSESSNEHLSVFSSLLRLKRLYSFRDLCRKMASTVRCVNCGTSKCGQPVHLKCGRRLTFVCMECRRRETSLFSMISRREMREIARNSKVAARGVTEKSKRLHVATRTRCGAFMYWRCDFNDLLNMSQL
jgi:hypothetical protein